MSGISQAKLEAAIDEIGPHLVRTIDRAPTRGRFTTRQLIDALRLDPAAEAAYQRALALLQDSPGWSHAATQVLHGQVIPEILRASPNIRFAGFAHGEPDDGTMVPCYWQRVG